MAKQRAGERVVESRNAFEVAFFSWSTVSLSILDQVFLNFYLTGSTGEASAQRYCKLTLGRKWVAHRQNLWNEFYDPTKTKNEIICNVPTGIDRTQWAHFVTYRLKPETLEICKKNKDNRNKQVIPHTGGSKPISRRRHEMFLETGQLPSRGKLYIETHKRKDGSFVNDAAKAIAEQIEVGLAESTTNESEVSPNDVVGRVLGPEHSGRVRCMGLGAASTNSFRNTRLPLSDLSLASSSTAASSSCSNQWQQKYTNLESQVQTTLGALKAYMIMKEGKIPDELAVFFDPQPQSKLQEGSNCSRRINQIKIALCQKKLDLGNLSLRISSTFNISPGRRDPINLFYQVKVKNKLMVESKRMGTVDIVERAKINFPYLKRIDLSNSRHLVETPDFSQIPKLERLDLSPCKIVRSDYLWVIYISREHCHFVNTGAHISFKSQSGFKIITWGLHTVFQQDLYYLEEIGYGKKYKRDLLHTYEPAFAFDFVTNDMTDSGPKIRLPYNWLVTEKDENENIEAKTKENNLSNVGL
ncbi:hypothetical protein Fmac_021190 [Flemingia macrophylla]|uniref:Uncharacterized protein n=1 Tax=Flemingia macrophylla TaxID=520843 RepID=A0ABD1LW51_9FABA